MLREKEQRALEFSMYPPVVAPSRGGGGKSAMLEAMQERYHRERDEIMQHKRMEALQYVAWPTVEHASDVAPPLFPGSYQCAPRTYTEQELEFRIREAAARATQEERKNSDSRLAIAADAAFENGRNYVEPTPKQPLPIHNAMRATLRAIEQYENKAFLPGGLLPLMQDA